MANFDALRPAVVGPLEYICRPKEKPDELLACFPLNGNLNDVSKYGRTMTAATTPIYTNDGPLGTCASFKGSFIHTATTSFTIDFFCDFPGLGQSKGNFFPNSSRQGSAGTSGGGIYGVDSTSGILLQMTGANLWFGGSPTVFSHFAITYNGTNLCGYLNGVRKINVTSTLNTQSSIQFVVLNAKYSNIRVLGKCLTTDTSFPVPTDFYTGFETL